MEQKVKSVLQRPCLIHQLQWISISKLLIVDLFSPGLARILRLRSAYMTQRISLLIRTLLDQQNARVTRLRYQMMMELVLSTFKLETTISKQLQLLKPMHGVIIISRLGFNTITILMYKTQDISKFRFLVANSRVLQSRQAFQRSITFQVKRRQ